MPSWKNFAFDGFEEKRNVVPKEDEKKKRVGKFSSCRATYFSGGGKNRHDDTINPCKVTENLLGDLSVRGGWRNFNWSHAGVRVAGAVGLKPQKKGVTDPFHNSPFGSFLENRVLVGVFPCGILDVVVSGVYVSNL